MEKLSPSRQLFAIFHSSKFMICVWKQVDHKFNKKNIFRRRRQRRNDFWIGNIPKTNFYNLMMNILFSQIYIMSPWCSLIFSCLLRLSIIDRRHMPLLEADMKWIIASLLESAWAHWRFLAFHLKKIRWVMHTGQLKQIKQMHPFRNERMHQNK